MIPQKVSVVCLSHNHVRFVAEAIYSVLCQTHKAVQLVVVDDASTDGSQKIIQKIIEKTPKILFVPLVKNVGNCKAFNIGLTYCVGDFIIDFAADDILLPERIEEGLAAFHSHAAEYGVHFSDAVLIDEEGTATGLHSDRFSHDSIPQGDVYQALIGRYFINGPTMMVRREVFDKLGGYDEMLAYEDFDFWICSSRHFKYCYTPKALVKKRKVRGSMSSRQFKRKSHQLISTYLVCKKIAALNQTTAEHQILLGRIGYEIRICLRVLDVPLLLHYFRLWRTVRNMLLSAKYT